METGIIEELMQLGLDEETAKKANGVFEERMSQKQKEFDEREKAGAEELKKVKLDAAFETALLKSGCENLRVLRALIKKDELTLDDKGSIGGFDEQIAALKADGETSFLFEKKTPKLVGMSIAEEGSDVFFDEGLTYEDLCKMQ
ncbi:MAG: phage scaffolding protein [Firmicutes bacterium]|nr:phage scaffolding protein [Bacillota bacterium]MBQ9604166.1 phage scaffolding protein [Bacillota bacterium]